MITLAEKLLLATNKEVKGAVEFVSSTAMTITPEYTNAGVTLQYSLNGTTWTTIATGATTPSANIIYFRGSATGTKSLYISNTDTNAWTFTGAKNLECNGKLDRLLQDTLGDDNDILTIGIYCFDNMFNSVTTLIKAPELPATTLDASCYSSMFQSCTGLTTAPELPGMTLADYCYYSMFQSCTGLTTAPELPATTLADTCYGSMFQSCTGLTVAPTLPAMTLSDGCYYIMFYGCTGLTTAPNLPAMTLSDGCYINMFYGCTGLKISTILTGIYDTVYRIPTTGTGTIKTNALTGMFASTGGTFTGTPTINTTYYTENTPV